KLDAGEVDATLLAIAGLKRLGLTAAATETLDADVFLPAVGQGIVAIETRADDAVTCARVAAIGDADSMVALTVERAFLAVLEGSCRTPIAGHATVAGGRVRFRGLIARPDGSKCLETAREGALADAAALGADAGEELKHRAGPNFFAAR
ncbi:MAG: hydroxymethylbilane synthase, partial [Hyphomicrobiales bacterium]|nr:hydroxymethylbilane synthase [Hyphomicrobiales bacterium]